MNKTNSSRLCTIDPDMVAMRLRIIEQPDGLQRMDWYKYADWHSVSIGLPAAVTESISCCAVSPTDHSKMATLASKERVLGWHL
jgi:hypothetical protein